MWSLIRKDVNGIPSVLHPEFIKILRELFWKRYKGFMTGAAIGVGVAQSVIYLITDFSIEVILINICGVLIFVHILFLLLILLYERPRIFRDAEKEFNRSFYVPEIKRIPSKYKIMIENEVIGIINQRLAKQNKLTDEELEELKFLHVRVHQIKEQMKDFYTQGLLRSWASEIEKIEFKMQAIWKFPQDKNFHRLWWTLPHCDCPKIDNAENYGTGRAVINNDCIIHGADRKPDPT